MQISFFFPAYYDEATVEPLALLADQVLAEICTEYEVIIIDDASPDKSGEVADRVAGKNQRIRVIHHEKNLGYGRVLQTGIRESKYEWIAFTDGDMQYDVRELPRLAAEAYKGAKIVAGYKMSRADGWKRELTSALYNNTIQILFGMKLRDADCAFKLMHRSIFEDFKPSLDYKEAFLLVEAFYRAQRKGTKIVQVPVSHRPRPYGDSSCFSWRTARRMAWYALRGAVFGRVLGGWK
ncbi:MAG: glycosyltransferase family 2 protein [Deltaproteobacteria bacterium]|nr:glycosyltransferase family 2 protein [Deltaproteobacteria bacterium]